MIGAESSRSSTLGGALRFLLDHLPQARRRQLAGLSVLIVVGALAEMATVVGALPFLSFLAADHASKGFGKISNALTGMGLHSSTEMIVATGILLMVLAVIAGAIRLWLVAVGQRWAFGAGHDLGVDIQRRILLQPYDFHIARNSSDVLAILEKVHMLSTSVLLQLVYGSSAAVVTVLIVATLVAIDPVAALFSLGIFGLLYALVSRVAARRLHRNSAISARSYDQRLRVVLESLGGIRDVIIDGSQQLHLESFRAIDREFTKASASTQFIGAAPRHVIEAVGTVVIIALALLLWSREGSLALALPILGAMSIGAFRLLPYLQQLYFSWAVLAGNRSIAFEVADFMTLPEGREGTTDAPAPMPFRNSIRLENVSFAYARAPRPALVDIAFDVPRGSVVFVAGRTGSGKSTLGDVLMGLLEPSSGRVLIDGEPLRPAQWRSWRRNIAHVPQSIFLADTSIARNIAFGVAEGAIDLERVEAAVRGACLQDVIFDLPQGLDTVVGERGARLSGGQRQRLGIARAIYRDAPVLFLDEATSALDSATEDAVLRSITHASEGRTIFIISHRASVMDYCDSIVRLDGGRLIETATTRAPSPGKAAFP
ncbi:ABC transporter ATP-binding protein/permease [Sphingomonas sp. SM33]|uniref:ABC transporter ATP-binding protein/permease n=1 Tax=Sphingomonas telluris TaxID=2907998 RepID=A0ABS9VLM2_9SPHN|nr:ABC transporter ATP-binding protein [Sphingomonas telluris]MCH8615863.1 ABC transporter ATP-binding protein/permease [Sphingomonas telluris]